MRTILLLVLLFITGCGESASEKRARLKREIDTATSQVAVLGEKLSKQVDEDGRFIKAKDVTEKDPWGSDIRIDYTTGWSTPVIPGIPGKANYAVLDPRDNIDTLTIASNGPDGLPHTKDDIGVSYKLVTREYLKAREEERIKGQTSREKNIEGNSSALTKGLTKGVLEAWKNRNK